jgi:chromosome segregation ATPase
VGHFDEAVHEAAKSVKPLVQALDDAQRECQEAIRYIHGLLEHLKNDRQALDEVVDALVHDAHEVEQALSGTTADATSNLTLMKDAVHHAAEEWEEVFGGEEKALAGASELLPELSDRVKELAEKAETSSHGVLEWASSVSHELDKAVESVEHAVSVGLTSMVADWRRGLEGTANKLVDIFEKECAEQVTAHEATWRPRVNQVRMMLGHAFDAIAEHEQKVKEYTDERWGELKNAQIEATKEVVRNVGDELSSLSLAVENDEGQLDVAARTVSEGQQHLAEAATQLAQALLEVRGRWGTFGITC